MCLWLLVSAHTSVTHSPTAWRCYPRAHNYCFSTQQRVTQHHKPADPSLSEDRPKATTLHALRCPSDWPSSAAVRSRAGALAWLGCALREAGAPGWPPSRTPISVWRSHDSSGVLECSVLTRVLTSHSCRSLPLTSHLGHSQAHGSWSGEWWPLLLAHARRLSLSFAWEPPQPRCVLEASRPENCGELWGPEVDSRVGGTGLWPESKTFFSFNNIRLNGWAGDS